MVATTLFKERVPEAVLLIEIANKVIPENQVEIFNMMGLKPIKKITDA